MATLKQPAGVTLIGAALLVLAGYASTYGVVDPEQPAITALGVFLLLFLAALGVSLIRGSNWARRLYLWGFPGLYFAVFITGFVRDPALTSQLLRQPSTIVQILVFASTALYLNSERTRHYFKCG